MKIKYWLVTLTLGLGLILATLWLVGGAASPITAAPAASGVISVCLSGGCDHDTVQAAVDAASSGDVIKVAAGVYTGVQNVASLNTATFTATQVVVITKSITIQGGYTTTDWDAPDPIAHPTTLDAQEQGRVLYVTGDVSVTIEGLDIAGGNAIGLGGVPSAADAGGGILVISATVAMRNNQVVSNTAHTGGGLCFYNSAYATLTGNTISHNEVRGGWHNAGGLYFYHSPTATLTANTINNNTVPQAGAGQKSCGGASFNYSDNAMLTGNTISGNRAANTGGGVCFNASDGVTLINNAIVNNARLSGWDGFGAGVYFNNSKNASLIGNTISGNTGVDIDNLGTILGGGLHIGNNSSATLNSNTISANGATRGGGLNIANSTVTLVSDIITGNTAYDFLGSWNYHPGGGGLYVLNSTVTLTNVVIADNQTETEGSALYVESSSPRLLHATIARNSGGDGSGVYITATLSSVALTDAILVSHTVGITVAAGNTVTLNGVLWYNNTINHGGQGSITIANEYVGDPAFAEDGYHLTAGSAAIDRAVTGDTTTDIDGDPRPLDGNGDGVAISDLGADEFGFRIYLPIIFKNGE